MKSSKDPKDLDKELQAYIRSSPVPYRDRLSTLQEIQASQPWYRRAWAWLADAHKLVTIVSAICAATVGAHAYIAGLITKANLKDEVRQAVSEAMFETRGDVSDLKDRTAGLPDWRMHTHDLVTRHEERISIVEKQEEKLETRFDKYLSRH